MSVRVPVEDAYRGETRVLTARRIPAVSLLLLVVSAVGTGIDWLYHPERAPALTLGYAVLVVVCTVQFAIARRRPVLSIVAAQTVVICVGLGLSAYCGAVHSSTEVLVVCLALLATGSALWFPWGLHPQITTSVGVLMGYPLALAFGATPVLPVAYEAFVLVAAVCLAALGAAVLDAHRLSTFQHAALSAALLGLGRTLSATLSDPQALATRLTEHTRAVFGADWAVLYQKSPEAAGFRATALSHVPDGIAEEIRGLDISPAGAPDLHRQLQPSGTVELVPAGKERVGSTLPLGRWGVSAALLQAIKREQEVIGILGCFYATRQQPFVERERELIAAIATQAGVALENARSLAALRGSEENLRAVFENMQDVYFRNDLDGTIRVVSPSVRRYGYEPDELIGQAARVIYLDPDDQQRVRTALFEHHSVTDFETRLKCKDGSVVWVSTSSHIVFDRQGRPAGFEGVLRDITARKQLEQQRADFMAMVAHDIRNPLTVIAGYTQMALESEGMPSEGRDLLSSIEHSTQTLLALVTNYLQHSQIEAGQITLTKQPLLLNALLEELCRQYGKQCARRHINLELRLVPDLPSVNGDPVALERVFTNLVQNALKFTPDGGWITIRSGQEGPNVVASVADNGPGIAPEEVPNLFVRYGRAVAGRSREEACLGLFIVKALVEAHGGSVQVASTIGVGTRFVVSLPAIPATSSA
jgi:PAS domain S-box-containing protein